MNTLLSTDFFSAPLSMYKTIIQESFSRHADSYDANADLQYIAAKKLLWYLDQRVSELPSGPILEIGCGTGFVSEGILERMPERKTIFSDISPRMLERCQQKITKKFSIPHQDFISLDGESIQEQNFYSLIISSFTFQWFSDLVTTLNNIFQALQPGGWLLFSLPIDGSFPQWQKACKELNLPFRANPLPKISDLQLLLQRNDIAGDLWEDDDTLSYKSSRFFFHSLKNVGAAKALTGKSLSPGQMKQLMRHMDRQNPSAFKMTYKIAFGCLQKRSDAI